MEGSLGSKSLSLSRNVHERLAGGSPSPSKVESKDDLQKKPHAKGKRRGGKTLGSSWERSQESMFERQENGRLLRGGLTWPSF